MLKRSDAWFLDCFELLCLRVSVAVVKHHDQCNLEKIEFIWGYISRLESMMVVGGLVIGSWNSPILIHKEEAESMLEIVSVVWNFKVCPMTHFQQGHTYLSFSNSSNKWEPNIQAWYFGGSLLFEPLHISVFLLFLWILS